jgi:hypothetical protein
MVWIQSGDLLMVWIQISLFSKYFGQKEIKKGERERLSSPSPPPSPPVQLSVSEQRAAAAGRQCNEEMLGVGLGVRLMVAVAPAPPVPAPPGKPPLPLCSSLRHRSSGWWFSNGDAHGRDSTTATTSSRATRRKWWSDPDGSQEDYGSSSLEEDEYGYGYDYDYEDEAAFPGFGGAGEMFDEPWFSKVWYIRIV